MVKLRVMVAMAMLAAHASAFPCGYSSKYAFEPGKGSQATVKGLFAGQYEEKYKDFKTSEWIGEVKDLEAAGAQTSTDAGDRLNYAWALYMAGKVPASTAIYEEMLKANPSNYEALCSYATVLQTNRKYAQAIPLLQKAVALKPGFRNNAEEFHLQMLEYQAKGEKNFNYAKEHIFLEALTPVWEARKTKPVEENLSKVEFPAGYTSQGIAELLRQVPRYGEAWMVLGMMLEHEKDFAMAAKAYDRAIERGTAHGADLRRYMTTFREFGRANDTGRLAGKRFLQAIALVVGVFILYRLYMIIGRVVADITGARAAKEEEARRRRMGRKDPDSPL